MMNKEMNRACVLCTLFRLPESASDICSNVCNLSNLASTAIDARPNLFQLDNSLKAVESYGKLAVPISGIFSFGAPSSTSSNGLFATSPFSATSALTSGNFKNDISNSSSNVVSPLTSISSTIGATKGSSTTYANSLFGSSVVSLVPKEPPAKFGFSTVSAKADSAPATTSTAETTDVKAKSETGTTFGNLK
ncbi:hypothetical protein BC332_03706 [Capsicum chinense]|nr:hypothetical protein BC332_03706 [Capsicum chinense]